MLKNRTTAYRIWWTLEMLLAATRAVLLILMAADMLSDRPEDEMTRRLIILLLVDFGTLLAFWGINLYLKIFGRLSSAVFILSPVFLLGMLVLSTVSIAYEGTQTGALINTLCWALTALYVLLPDVFIAAGLIGGARSGFSAPDPEPEKLTASERIRAARK